MTETKQGLTEVENWFNSLKNTQQNLLISQLEERRSVHYFKILPRLSLPNFPNLEDLQKELLLEQYYSLMSILFRGVKLENAQKGLGRITNRDEIDLLLLKAKAEIDWLMPVVWKGNWTPLKDRWRFITTSFNKDSSILDEILDNAASVANIPTFEKKSASLRKFIDKLPDKSEPLDPRDIDPDKPLIPF